MAWTNAHLDGSAVGHWKLVAGSLLEYVAIDHEGDSMGTAILEVVTAHKGKDTGRDFAAIHIGAASPYYQ